MYFISENKFEGSVPSELGLLTSLFNVEYVANYTKADTFMNVSALV